MSSNDQPQQDAILDVRDLSVSYGATKAVDKVSLHINRREIFGLLGPNGAGKTSTLSAIEGLLKPDSGTVLVDGVDVRRHPAQARSKMGVQLQATSFQAQLSIKQIVQLYAGLYGIELSDRQITEGLDAIGLGHEALKLFKQLSSGQQQRLSLFVAVIHNPVLLLLDEPTSGLDPQSRRQSRGRASNAYVTREAAFFSPPTRWRRPRPCVTGSPSSIMAGCWRPVLQTS